MGGLGGFVEDFTGINMGGDSSSDKALRAQQGAASEANATQKYMYDQTRADTEPWRQAGLTALSGLNNPDFQKDFTMNDFQADPGYQFRMAEGQKAIERSAAARGNLMSGATMKAMTRFGQDTASNEFQNSYNRYNQDRDKRFGRLAAISGGGQTANSEIANAGQSYAQNYGANVMGSANAQAGQAMGQMQQRNQMMGQVASGAALMFSDARLKTGVEAIAADDLNELRAAIKPYLYQYTSDQFGEGEWVGVMAQDLIKTKLGRKIVVTDEHGSLQLDIRKIASLMLACLAGGQYAA